MADIEIDLVGPGAALALEAARAAEAALAVAQSAVATVQQAANAAIALNNFYPTIAAGEAATAIGGLFASVLNGGVTLRVRTATGSDELTDGYIWVDDAGNIAHRHNLSHGSEFGASLGWVADTAQFRVKVSYGHTIDGVPYGAVDAPRDINGYLIVRSGPDGQELVRIDGRGNVILSNTKTYADEAAATAASLPKGALYATSTGAVRVKL